jgi:hypothetical protein
MTTLNMDLAIAETAYGRMASAVKKWAECQGENRKLMRDYLYEDQKWLGASAKNFYDTYIEVDSQINAQLFEYAKLTEALYNEMIEWYICSQRLSGVYSGGPIKIGPITVNLPPIPPEGGQVKIGGITLDVPPIPDPKGQVTIDGTTVDIP